MTAMVVEQAVDIRPEEGAPQDMDVDQADPATPEKEVRVSQDEAAKGDGSEPVPPAASEKNNPDLKTPPKQSQGEESVAKGEHSDDGEDDSNEALGLQLYYLLLRSLFKELDLYAQPVEAGLLDAKKQMLVYHYAARLYDLRVDVLGALHGDFALTANLPIAFQKIARKLRKKLQEQGQVERLGELNEKHVFGHDHAIRFVESNLPAGAKEHCVWLREKPHASSDVVKSISPFRDVIKFHCFRNPLMLIEDHSMGLALTIEKTFPVAYLVVSPFLRKPEVLQKALKSSEGHGKMSWQILEESLSEHLMNFIAESSDGWRAFVQRRANIISKGSLTIIQRVLRLNPSKEGLDASAINTLQDLQEEVEELREKAKKAEETAKKILGKENMALEGKLDKIEGKNIDLSVLAERLQSKHAKLVEELDSKELQLEVLDKRADAAEQSVLAQSKHVEDLGLRTQEAEEKQQQAEAALGDEKRLRYDAQDSQAEMSKELRGKIGEASLLACGVQEMTIELRKSQSRTKKAIEQVGELKQAQASLRRELNQAQATKKAAVEHAEKEAVAKEALDKEVGELKQAQASHQRELNQAQATEKAAVEHAEAKEAVAKEALDNAAKAAERAAEAERKEVVAVATLQVKTEAVDRITESNVALRAEAAMAKDQVEEAERAKKEAYDEAEQARQELQGRDDEILRLKGVIDEQQASVVTAKSDVVTAKSDVEKARELQVAAEREKEEADSKAAEACSAEAETAARLQIKMGEIANLTASCSTLGAEVSKLTETLQKESERVVAAEQATMEVQAQLDVKARTIETMTADSTALRVSLLNARESAEEAVQKSEKLVAAAEKAASAACESEKDALTKLKSNLEAIAELEATIADLRAKPEPSQELLAELASARAEADECKRQVADAERLASEARSHESEMSARLTIKVEEAAGLVNECAGLRADAARLGEQATVADERAAEAQAAERAAKTSLQFKTDDVERVCAANVELRTEIIDAQQKAAEALKRAVAAESSVEGAHRSRDHAFAELRGKVKATESMAAAIGAVRAEAQAARAAETAAIEVAKKANEEVSAAGKKVSEAHRTESQATAKLEVKSKEASRLTSECSTLRAEATLLREKGVASARAIQALGTRCETLQSELAASEAKHDWSKLQQPVPDFAPSDLTLEDFENALTQPAEAATGSACEQSTTEIAVAPTLGRRLRSKGPESRQTPPPVIAAQAAAPVEVEVAPTKRARAKTPEPPVQKPSVQKPPVQKPPVQKRARVASADAIPQIGDEVDFLSYQGCKIAEILGDGSIQVAITGLGRMKADPGQWKLKGQVAIDAD